MATKADKAIYAGIVSGGGTILITARAVAASVVGATLRHVDAAANLTDIPGVQPAGNQSLFTWRFDISPGPPATIDLIPPTTPLPTTFDPPPEFDLRLTAIGLSPTDPSEREVIVSLSVNGSVKVAQTIDGATGTVGHDDEVIVVNHALRLVIR